jgi:hypothetical protein
MCKHVSVRLVCMLWSEYTCTNIQVHVVHCIRVSVHGAMITVNGAAAFVKSALQVVLLV